MSENLAWHLLNLTAKLTSLEVAVTCTNKLEYILVDVVA